MINFSGTMLTVMDLRILLALPALDSPAEALVVVGRGDRAVAFPVAALVGAVDASGGALLAPPRGPATERGYVTGVAAERIGVLDIERILSDDALLVEQ